MNTNNKNTHHSILNHVANNLQNIDVMYWEHSFHDTPQKDIISEYEKGIKLRFYGLELQTLNKITMLYDDLYSQEFYDSIFILDKQRNLNLRKKIYGAIEERGVVENRG